MTTGTITDEIFTTAYHDNISAVKDIFTNGGVTRDDIDDMCQTVFANVWESRETHKPYKSTLRTWINRIAHNALKNYIRDAQNDIIEYIDPIHLDHYTEQKPVQEINHLANEVLTIVKANFSESDQEMLYLWMDGYTYKKIAEVVGLTDQQVENKLKYIKARTRELVA